MKIVQPYARLLSPFELDAHVSFTERDGVEALRKIEWAARISHRSEDEQKETSWERFIRSVVLQHGDWSVVEHASVSVDFYVDRGITHELVRHRLFGFTQESTRFVNYEKKMPPSFIYPKVGVLCRACSEGYEPQHVKDSMNSTLWMHWDVDGLDLTCDYNPLWLRAIATTEEAYRGLVKEAKWPPQEARSVFPNGLASRVVVTGNLRNWRLFLLMRTTKEAHPQMRQVCIPLLKEFQQKIPILYEDILPEERQVVNIAKGR